MSAKYQQRYFYVSDWILKVTGVYSPSKEDNKREHIYHFHVLYNVVWSVIGIIYMVLEIFVVKDLLKDLQRAFKHIAATLSHALGVVKVMIVVINRKKIDQIKRNLENEQNLPQSSGKFQPNKIFEESKVFNHKLITIVFILYHMVAGSGYISSWFNLNLHHKEEYFDGNVTCFDFLSLYYWIPFETPNKSRCQYAFFMMYVGNAILAAYIGVYDTLFATILMCAKTQMQILCGAAETVRERSLARLKLPLNYRIFRDEENPKLDDMIYEELTDCAKQLDFLLNTYNEIENIFTYTTLGQVLVSLLVVASCMYNFTLVSFTDLEFFSIVVLMNAVLSQLAGLCYYGNAIAEQSSSFSDALYHHNWLSASKRNKQCVIIIMTRMQKKFFLTIGKFSPLSLATFLSVVKGSFTYYAVFKTVE